jgi:hypothetical protein
MGYDAARNPTGKGGFGDHPESINCKGRPRRPEVEIFKEALQKLKEENGVDILEHAVMRSYKNDAVLIALMRKMVPDLSEVDSRNFTLQDLAALIANDQKQKADDVIDAEVKELDDATEEAPNE